MPNSDPVIQSVIQEAQDRADAEQAQTGIQKKLGMPMQIDVKKFISGLGDNFSSGIFDKLSSGITDAFSGDKLGDIFSGDNIIKGLSGKELASSLSFDPATDLEEQAAPSTTDNDPTSGVFDGGGDIDLG